MKKEYKKPMAEIVEFVPENDIMNDVDPDEDVDITGSVPDDF